jgi:hypothetical protein
MALDLERQREIASRICDGVSRDERNFCRAVGDTWLDAYLISWAQRDDCYRMLLTPKTFWPETRFKIIEGRQS